MSNANPAANDCTRCNGTAYLPQYRHIAGGKCFGCGRKLGASAPIARTEFDRGFFIRELDTLIRVGRQHIERGEGAGWLEDVCNPDYCAPLAWKLRDAPADVRTRAIAAFARMGLDVSHVPTMVIAW